MPSRVTFVAVVRARVYAPFVCCSESAVSNSFTRGGDPLRPRVRCTLHRTNIRHPVIILGNNRQLVGGASSNEISRRAVIERLLVRERE